LPHKPEDSLSHEPKNIDLPVDSDMFPRGEGFKQFINDFSRMKSKINSLI